MKIVWATWTLEMFGYSDRVLIYYCKINYYSRKNK
jgi:hypothetical protein